MGRLTGLMIAVAAAAATAAGAAPPASTPGQGKAAPPRIFLSPSGEPFRPGPDHADPLKAWFDQVDAAHRGYIDRADFRADAARFFKKLDENGDGVIDGFEVADYESKVVPELAEAAEGRLPGQFGPPRGRSGGPGGENGHRRGGGDPGTERPGAAQAEAQPQVGAQGRGRSPQRPIMQLIDEPEPVSGADFALDSHITLAEWMRATDQRFEILDEAKNGKLTLEILDANKDGRISLDELRARFLPTRK
jgi:Ca2+-binding EF-hand superfamily protein